MWDIVNISLYGYIVICSIPLIYLWGKLPGPRLQFLMERNSRLTLSHLFYDRYILISGMIAILAVSCVVIFGSRLYEIFTFSYPRPILASVPVTMGLAGMAAGFYGLAWAGQMKKKSFIWVALNLSLVGFAIAVPIWTEYNPPKHHITRTPN